MKEFNDNFQMKIKLHFVPKYHCELNPIEMYWANLKWFFRANNEQSTDENVVMNLIIRAREHYKTLDTNNRIFGKFWRVIESYHNGETYQEVMKHHFKAKSEIKRHRKIYSRS